MPEIRVIIETKDEKSRIDLEAKKLGLSTTGFFRLLYKNWIGEIKLERKDVSTNKPEGGA